MDNATPLEVTWTALFFVGGGFGTVLLGYYLSKLIRRYRLSRNGGGRLLAWREVLVIGLLTVAIGLGASLGVLAMAAPPRAEQATGEVERWAVDVLSWYAALSILGIGACIVGALATLLAFEIRINRYFLDHPAASGDPGDSAARGLADESPFGPAPEPREE